MDLRHKVLLTGAKGFLGNYIQEELSRTSCVDTLGRSNCTWNVDLSLDKVALNTSYDLVVHCAGKAHSVPRSNDEKQQFFEVNVKGTENLLKSLEGCPSLPKAFVFVSSVAVYGLDYGKNITEDHPLTATDPYGKSKIQAEALVSAWCASHDLRCSILRLPLIAGVNPPGNLQSMINSISKGFYFNVAGGHAKKSIILAADVAKLILKVSDEGGIYNLTDGYHPSFRELAAYIAAQLHKSEPLNMPRFLALILGKAGDLIGSSFPVNSGLIKKMTSDLTFNNDKAVNALGWKPMPVLGGFRVR